MVDCVAIVERRHHVATRLKTCHKFEVYFRVRCGKATKATPYIEERTIAVHVWMMGVGFIVLFMTPFFVAMQTGSEDAED